MAKHKIGRRTTEGRVVKAENSKTRVVVIDQRIPHGLYGRIIQRTVKFVAHDEQNESKLGDLVRIRECRPMSKTKRWYLTEILERSADE